MIFRSLNSFSDSVRDAESHDIKFLTKFPGNPILEILIKFCNFVGGTNMRGCFPKQLCVFAMFNCPMILRYFLV